MPQSGSDQRDSQVLAYHMVEPRFDFGITRVTPRQFRRQMDWLEQTGYRPVRLDALFGGANLETCVALTFDDAYRSVYTWAFPVLAECSWVATVFPVVGYVGASNTWDVNLGGLKFRHMDWDELRNLSRAGWQIGSHGWSHRYLDVLNDRELEVELRRSKATLEDRLGIAVTSFSPPFGRTSERVIAEALEAGYREVCLLDGWARRRAQKGDLSCIIPRRGVYLVDTLWDFRQKFAEPGMGPAWQDAKQTAINWANRGAVVVQRAREKTLAILSRLS